MSVWTDDTIDLRRRLLPTTGVPAAQDQRGPLEIQFAAAFQRGGLTVELVPGLVVHRTHSAGWLISTTISGPVETNTRRRADTAADASNG